MANTHSEVPPVLTCWKDIAQYLGKGVRTVQRWEQEFGLPVRRPNGIDHKSPVAAHPGDLDAWLQTRWSSRNGGRRHRKQDFGNSVKATAGSSIKLTVNDLSEAIRTSRELRLAHLALISQTRNAIKVLLNSCSELHVSRVSTRRN